MSEANDESRLTAGLGADPKGEWPDDYLTILTRRALFAAYEGQRVWCRVLEHEVANCAKRIHNQRAEINRLADEIERLKALTPNVLLTGTQRP